MKVYAKCIDGQQEAAKKRIENAFTAEDEEPTQPGRTLTELCRAFAATSEIQRFRMGLSGTDEEGPSLRSRLVRGLVLLVVAGEGFEPSKLSRRIYSPLPLAARATRLGALRGLPWQRRTE